MGWVYTGYVWEGPFVGLGTVGYSWSSTSAYANNAYYLAINNDGGLSAFNNYDRRIGYPIRCVAKKLAMPRMGKPQEGGDFCYAKICGGSERNGIAAQFLDHARSVQKENKFSFCPTATRMGRTFGSQPLALRQIK